LTGSKKSSEVQGWKVQRLTSATDQRPGDAALQKQRVELDFTTLNAALGGNNAEGKAVSPFSR